MGNCSCLRYIIITLHIFHLVLSISAIADRFESLLEFPRSGSTRIRNKSRRVLHIGEFGATGDGFTDDTEAFGNAWKIACSSSTRTRILIPNNYTSLLRSIDFAGPCKTRLTLQIAGTIVAPEDPDAWEGLNPRKWLYFHGVNRLSIEGGGVIDGMGQEWWRRSCKVNKTNPCHHAPTALTFHRCKNLRIQNLKLMNSQQMHIAFTTSSHVTVSNLEVIAPGSSPNTDGIHMSASHGMLVRDCLIKTGDDCISIVNNSSKIQIKNILCGPGHGISIGSLGKSKSWERVHDVVVDGAFLSNTDNGLRIKTWQGGRGLASNIVFRNVYMENVSNPIIIDQYYCDSSVPCSNQTSGVKVENISFVNIRGTSATEDAIIFACSEEFPCRGLYLEDVLLTFPNGGIVESLCWEAYGASAGFVHPPPCFSQKSTFIKQKFSSDTEFRSGY